MKVLNGSQRQREDPEASGVRSQMARENAAPRPAAAAGAEERIEVQTSLNRMARKTKELTRWREEIS